LFGNPLETFPASIQLENSPNDSCLVLADFETHACDERSAMLVYARRILDRHITIAKTSASRVEPLERSALDTTVRFLRELPDVEAVYNSVRGKKDFGLFRLSVDPLADKD
jgi:hypothetical protein